MRTASSNSHPCPKCSGETVSFSTATATGAFSLAKGGSSGGIFLRRALIAAAFSSANGGCCGFLSCVILLQNIMFLVQKRLFCILPCNKSTIHLSSYEICSLFSSFSTAKDQISDHKSNFIVVNSLQSCELSSEKAAKTAKCRTCHTKSSSSSLSIEFFKQSGWSDAQVMKLMQREPRLLRASVETILKPRMRSLRDMGFSDTQIVQLVSSCPSVLLRDIQPRINFWSLFNFSTAKDQSSEHRTNFIVCNPLQSCELSSEKTAKTAKYHTCHKKSSSLSIEFFKQNGWSDVQVMKLTKKEPKLLCANVETTLKPRLRSLQDMGFSDTEIVQLLSTCPDVLLRNIQPKLNFLRSLLGSNERLLKACRRNRFLLTSSLAQKIEPNISLLRECGISDECIARMLVLNPGFVARKSKFIKEVMEHVEELGVPHDCGMFPHALLTVLNLSRSKCDATFATLKSFGWSQPDIVAILRKNPSIWRLSKKNISDKITFLTKEAGCELQYIIRHPGILSYSLEKRVRPRHEVINFLEQNKLLDKGHSLLYFMPLTEQKFMNQFLFPYKEKFTALYNAYVAAKQYCARDSPSDS
ncbi:unnamed protein product [Musa acuminata var. zebrina]